MLGTRNTSHESIRVIGRMRPYNEAAFDRETRECYRCGIRIGRHRDGERLGVCRDCFDTDPTYLKESLGWERPPTVSVLQEECKRGHRLQGTNRDKGGCVVCQRARTYLKGRGITLNGTHVKWRERRFREALEHVLARTDEVGAQLARDALGAQL